MNSLKVFGGGSNPTLVKRICESLEVPPGKIKLDKFPSGEDYPQFLENIRGSDVFLIQSLSRPVNDQLMQLLLMSDAARRASAGRITAVIPYMGYARQDRKDKPRVPISAKLVMDLLAAAGFDRILTMDLHAPQIGGFTNIPFDHLSFKPALERAIKPYNIDVVAAPDVGSLKRADEFATLLGCDLALITKKRESATEVSVKHFIGDVEGKRVLVVDDLTESAGTLIQAARECHENKAAEVFCAITHGCFTQIGEQRLMEEFDAKRISRVFVSNTVDAQCKWTTCVEPKGAYLAETLKRHEDKITIVDVAPLFASAIERIHNNLSVSSLFQ